MVHPNEPLVSICIPTFRRLGYLREAVASAQAQTHRHVEILIGDDGSSQELRQWALEEARRDPRVKYGKNPQRLGLAGNWDALAQACAGEFLVIIGDDDRLHPAFTERLLRQAGPKTAVVFSNHRVIDATGGELPEETAAFLRIYKRASLAAGRVEDAAACVWSNSVPMSAALIRAKEVKRLGFRHDLNTPEIELFARLAAERQEFVFLPEFLADYRVHAGSETAAGLRSEALVRYLEPIAVPRSAESIKREFMEPLLLGAVTRLLREGRREEARRFLASRYYPAFSRSPIRAGLHHLAVMLPGATGGPLLRGAARARKLIRTLGARVGASRR